MEISLKTYYHGYSVSGCVNLLSQNDSIVWICRLMHNLPHFSSTTHTNVYYGSNNKMQDNDNTLNLDFRKSGHNKRNISKRRINSQWYNYSIPGHLILLGHSFTNELTVTNTITLENGTWISQKIAMPLILITLKTLICPKLAEHRYLCNVTRVMWGSLTYTTLTNSWNMIRMRWCHDYNITIR